MNIGIDYGGVITYALDSWADTIARVIAHGNTVYLVSHAVTQGGLDSRRAYCERTGMIDLSFADLTPAQETEIRLRKARLCKEYGIQVFLDDSFERAMAVGELCRDCAVIYVPQSCWPVGQQLIESFGKPRWYDTK